MPGEPVPALTSGPAYPAIFYPSLFGPGEVISYAMPGEPVPALTSGPAYPAVLYLGLFGPGRGC